MKTCDDNKDIVFKAWKESSETYTLKPKGDSILEARLCRKYGGLQWLDPQKWVCQSNGTPLKNVVSEDLRK